MAEELGDTTKKKNWFVRHKVLSVILAIIVIAAIGNAMGSGSSNNSTPNKSSSTGSKTSSTKTYRFAGRADKQPKDVEVLVGESATVNGVKMTVDSAEYKTSMSDYETADTGKTYVLASVTLQNTSDRTQPYNEMNFRVQTAGGQVLDTTYATMTSPLHSGDLVTGGKVQGQIVFQVPVEDGHQYLIWKPGLSSDRAIVQVK